MIPVINDPVYLRFLAVHAGLWSDIGVLDDTALLQRLRCEHRTLGLPFDRWVPPKRLERGQQPRR